MMKKVCSKLLSIGVTLTIIGIIGMVVLSILGIFNSSLDISDYIFGKAINIAEPVELTSADITIPENAEINSVDIDVDFGEITVVRGGEFSVHADNVEDEKLKVSLDGGNLTVKYTHSDNIFNLLDGKSPTIEITLPEKAYENVGFDVNAGELYAYDIEAENFTVNFQAGEADFSGITAKNSAQIKMNAGEAEFLNSSFNNCNLKMSAGEMNFYDCIVAGQNNIKLNAGELNMELIGSRHDYDITVDKTAGKVLVNGDEDLYNYAETTMVVTEVLITSSDTEVSHSSADTRNSIDIDITAGECSIDFLDD